MTKCLKCPLFAGICDFTSPECRLSIEDLMTERRDLLRIVTVKQQAVRAALTAKAQERKGMAALGMKKYDKRRKPDTPERQLGRIYYRQRKAKAAAMTDQTCRAVGEMVQTAFEQYGGTGDAGAVVLR